MLLANHTSGQRERSSSPANFKLRRYPKPASTRKVLAAACRAGGRTAAMSESEIEAPHGELPRTGLDVEPTCAGAAGALSNLPDARAVRPEELWCLCWRAPASRLPSGSASRSASCLTLGLGPSDLAERDRLRLTQPFLTGSEQEWGLGIDVTVHKAVGERALFPPCRRLLFWRAQRPLDNRPLPAFARLEFIAEDIATHDGSLSIWTRSVVDARLGRAQGVRLCDGLLVLGGNSGRPGVESDRDLDSPFCLWMWLCIWKRRRIAGVSDDPICSRHRYA